jgi:hypothetical protein
MHRAFTAHVLGIVHVHVPLAGWGWHATPVTPSYGRLVPHNHAKSYLIAQFYKINPFELQHREYDY